MKLLYLDPMYFRFYVRQAARENYTTGSSIFRKLYLRAFGFFNFYTSGATVLQKLYSMVVKNRIFKNILGLGIRPNILTSCHFLLEVPLLGQ